MSKQGHQFRSWPVFGSSTPFAEPDWYQGAATPYYNESHVEYRAKVRAFVDKEVAPFVHEWDESGTYPRELHRKAYEAGVYGSSFPHALGGRGPADPDHVSCNPVCRHVASLFAVSSFDP
jgi:alkylation response protein AidB-like acyl-CoA dehydrogenase